MSLAQPAEHALVTNVSTPKASPRQMLARLLDFPGGRFLLGKMASRYATRLTGDDVGIFYSDGLWTHRARGYFFPDSRRFDYAAVEFARWKNQGDRYLSDASDYWLQHYRPKEGDTIVDVGAGRGEDTLTFSQAVGRTGRVIAIEADPLSFLILTNFCRLNGLMNVTPLHLALMDRPGEIYIKDATSSWLENSVGSAEDGIAVVAETLDRVCAAQSLGDISFLKMNIEGAERQALLGMVSTLQHVRQICVACHDFRYRQGHGEQFRTRAFVEEFLAGNGLRLASRGDDPRDYVRDHIFGLRTEE